MKDCYSTGNVKSNSTNFMAYAGGLIGSCDGSIINCFATGDVLSKGSNEVYSRNGGVIGYSGDTCIIENVYRSNTQVLTRYTTVSASYNKDGVSDSISNIKTSMELLWNNSVWRFDKSYPLFKR